MPRCRIAIVFTVCAITFTACSTDGDDTPADPTAAETPADESPADTGQTPSPSPTVDVRVGPVEPADVDVLATGLDVPWDLAFLPDGTALVSERVTGRILEVSPGGDLSEIGQVDGVAAAGEGGLHGIWAHDDWLYAYYTASGDNRVVRMPFDGSSLGEQEIVVDGIPKAGNHNGGRMLFGPDDMLYITTGDAANDALAQDLDSLAGKILRLTPDGDVPDDNPFDDSPVWSYGHRNVQGITFDEDGRLWASEFGPSSVDELNLIEAGENYGWPEVDGIAGDESFTDAVAEWPVEVASPSGLAYVDGTLFMGALRGQRLWQIPLGDDTSGEVRDFDDGRYLDGLLREPQDFFAGEYGRLRHVELAPDGTLWILTNNTDGRNPDGPGPDDDRILRVELRPS